MGENTVLPTSEPAAAQSPTPGQTSSSTTSPKPDDEFPTPGVVSRWSSYLKTEISLDHADLPVLACCLVSGLCDSSAYNAWSCFVSMQTGMFTPAGYSSSSDFDKVADILGNTIFLALGASNQPVTKPYGWLKSLCSISFFILGCIFFSFTRIAHPSRRGVLAVSFVIQAICVFIAASLVQAHVVPSPVGLLAVPEDLIDFRELIPLGFLAFQSGGQMVTSRLLGFNEIPTTVLTSVYCDIASDPKVLERKNVKRNRRIAAVVSILVGGIAGGWLSRSAAGMSSALWIAGAIKVVLAVAWASWKAKGNIEL